MSAGWEVGDLAVALAGDKSSPGYWTCPGAPKKGEVFRVVGIDHGASINGPWIAISLHGRPSPHFTGGWNSRCFRKIKPDQQSGERTDWELLLDSVNAGKVEA